MRLEIGRHFLHVPGPTNIPHRVLQALSRPTVDHRGPEFAEILARAHAGMQEIFRTSSSVVMFPGSGSGAGEAAFVNTLSPGDRVLMFDHGFFAKLWCDIARRLGVTVDFVPGDWRRALDLDVVAERLVADRGRDDRYRAVVVVHNETSTGVMNDVPGVRAALDIAGHDALLIVDAVSSLGSMDYRHDEWRVDVTITGSQKGLMLPPGIGFNAVSDKALAASELARLPRVFWDWRSILATYELGYFPTTPSTNLFFGLLEAIELFREEGLDRVFARHARHAEATRTAVEAWGLECNAVKPRERSNSVTAVRFDGGVDTERLRARILERFDLSLGGGIDKLAGRILRIGHLGHLNDPMLLGALSGIEMGLLDAGIDYEPGGVTAALEYLARTTPTP